MINNTVYLAVNNKSCHYSYEYEQSGRDIQYSIDIRSRKYAENMHNANNMVLCSFV